MNGPKTCGSCAHFHPVPGTRRGRCAVRRWPRDKRGRERTGGPEFEPVQSRTGCADYEKKEERT